MELDVKRTNMKKLELTKSILSAKSCFRKIQVFIFLVFTIPTFLFSQELRFKRYTKKDGLSTVQSYTCKIIQDEQGFLWIPSLNGLNRFDGREFKVFQYEGNDPSGLLDNAITDICKGENNEIWIGHGGGGISIFDPETESYEHLIHDPNDPESLCGNDIRSIHKDRDGNMWINVVPSITCFCKKGSRKFKSYPKTGVNGFVHAKDGTIWTGSPLGLFRYVPEQDTFEYFNPSPNLNDIKYKTVGELIETDEGEIWVSSKRFASQIFTPESKTFRDFPENLIVTPGKAPRTFLRDKENNIWFGDWKSVAKYDTKKDTLKVYRHDPKDQTSCSLGSIVALFQDRAGSLWTSGWADVGVSVVHTLDNPFTTLPLDYNDLIPFDEEHILIGKEDGIFAYNIYKNKFIGDLLPTQLRAKKVDNLRFAPTGDLWWVDRGEMKIRGYNIFTNKKKVLNNSRQFELDSKGNIWFSFPSYFNIKKNSLIDYSQKIIQADSSGKLQNVMYIKHSIAVDNLDQVWLGTNLGGLIRYNPSSEKVSIFQHDPNNPLSLAKGQVNKIITGANGWIYISTANAFSIYKPELDQFINLDKTNGLPNTVFPPMVEDKNGYIWIGAQNGLVRLNPKDLSIQNFDIYDGVPDTKFWDAINIRDSLGNVYLSMWDSSMKVIKFHPDSVKLHNFTAPVIVTDLFLNLEKINIGDQDSILRKNISYQKEIVLRYTQSDFGFQFISPNFYKSDKIEYFYQLENYDKEWVSIGNKLEVHFTNIPAGK